MKTGATIFKRDGTYYLWYWGSDGKRKKISCHTKSKTEAKAYRDSFLKGETTEQKSHPPITIKQFESEYFKHSKAHHKPKSHLNVKSCFHEFLKWLKNNNLPLQSISVRQAQEFIDYKHEDKTAATARRIHTALKAAFNDALRWEYIRSNPFKEVKKPRLVKKDPEWLDVPTFNKFMQHILASEILPGHTKEKYSKLTKRELEAIENKRSLFWLVVIAFNTGLRSGELRNLRFGAVDLDQGQINVKNTDEFVTKSSRGRVVPMTAMCRDVLQRLKRQARDPERGLVFPLLLWGKEKVMHESYVAHEFKKWITSAGLNSKIHLHSMRHSFAAALLKRAVPQYRVGKLLGHQNGSTTDIYSHLQQSDLAEAVRVLDFMNGVQKENVEQDDVPEE
jgi:integrase/recombinase XerD